MKNSSKRPTGVYDPAAMADGPITMDALEDLQGASLAAPPVPSKRFQDEAFEYISKWCKAAREFVDLKKERWKLLEDLYHNRRDLNSWTTRSNLTDSENRAGLRNPGGSGERWQSDIILAPSYIVDSWADRAYQAIFNGPDWLSVVPERVQEPQGADVQYPTSYKLQELLLARLSQGQIHVRLYEILQHLVLYGSVYAKVFWYSKSVTRHRWQYETLEVVDEQERVYDCPIVQVIPGSSLK
ncbi:hypothetical protein ACFL2Q_07570 [Thermodesulfobacteriota bacterium]